MSRDPRGGWAAPNMLGFAPAWFVVFGVFVLDVQLNRLKVAADLVEHAAALGADTATKTLCSQSGAFTGAPFGSSGARADAVAAAVEPVLDSIGRDSCRVVLDGADGGGAEMVVEVQCRVPCSVPFASLVMCEGGVAQLSARQTARPMGCDAKEPS